MTRLCPTCSHPIPSGTRGRFCPRCSLRGALELAEEDSIPPLEEGRILGDYELIEQLGRGGMGVVYRARQRSLNRFVALKVLVAGEFADESTRRRFESEAAAVAHLRHPNIVPIYEIGTHEGQPFFSMELIEGRTFADLVRDGPLPPETAARLLKPVAESVHFAHQQGVLHRDLKPSNLLLDAFGVPRVTDFGLARRLDSPDALTLTGEVLGSPSYLAPEQAMGDRKREGPATDVYALGAILYHLLTGRPPFLGESPHAIIRQVLENDPISPRRLNPAVPPDLETVCCKCLEKPPARRYPSALEVAQELGRFLNHEPLRARPVGVVGNAWRWSLRHPAKASLVVALAITLATVSIVPTVAYFRVRKAEQERSLQLRETLLTRARAVRMGGHSGQQREGWASLVQAAGPLGAKGDTNFILRLRREAIANLAMDDGWFEPDTNLPPIADPTLLRLDASQRLYAAGAYRGPVKIVRVKDRTSAGELVFTNQTVQHVLDFSSDRRFLALRHGEQVAIWDIPRKRSVVAQPSGLNQFSFHPDGKAVAFVRAGKITCYELPSGELLWEHSVAGLPAKGPIAFAPNGNFLAAGLDGEKGVKVVAVDSGEAFQLQTVASTRTLRWSANGKSLAAGGEDGSVRIWDFEAIPGESSVKAHSTPWVFETQGSFIQALAFSPDGRWLAAAGSDSIIRLIDARAKRLGLSFNALAFQVDFSPDGSRVGPVWQSGQVGWVHVSNAPAFRSVRFPSRGFSPALAIDSSGKIAIADGGNLLVYEAGFDKPPLRLPMEAARAAYFEPDGGLIGLSWKSAWRWPTLRTNVVQFGQPVEFLSGSGGEVAAFSRDRRITVVANYLQNGVDVVKDGAFKFRLPHDRLCNVTLQPDGKQIVSSSLDLGDTHLWDAETGKLIKSWPDEGNNRAVFSPDGLWLAEFGPRCVVKDTKTWDGRRVLEDVPANSGSSDAAFSPDGRWLAVIMADREVHLLKVGDFSPIAVFEAPSGTRLHRVAWNSTGSNLAVLAAQNELQLWDLTKVSRFLQEIGADWQN